MFVLCAQWDLRHIDDSPLVQTVKKALLRPCTTSVASLISAIVAVMAWTDGRIPESWHYVLGSLPGRAELLLRGFFNSFLQPWEHEAWNQFLSLPKLAAIWRDLESHGPSDEVRGIKLVTNSWQDTSLGADNAWMGKQLLYWWSCENHSDDGTTAPGTRADPPPIFRQHEQQHSSEDADDESSLM